MSEPLTLDDIADLRAYERERPAFRAHVVELRKRRRVPLGPVVMLVFENRDTVRFQIQEMARVERLMTDDAIQVELDIYNSLVPSSGRLCATLFVELTDEAQMREWLPKLVGIEHSLVLRAPGAEVRGAPEEQHEAQLTRDTVTAAVHYLVFPCTPAQAGALTTGPVTLTCDHPSYAFETPLAAETVAEIGADLAS